jgi:hypothetical protein
LAANSHILSRLAGIRNQLLATHQAGSPFSATTKGHERETFVHSFLSEVFPTPFRFGTGDVTDIGAKSGELDVIVSIHFLRVFRSWEALGPGSYLAESVAAVIEVKSNMASQRDEALKTARAPHQSFGSTVCCRLRWIDEC